MAGTVWSKMVHEIKSFDETTLADAKLVGVEMYSSGVWPLLEKILRNPLRKEFNGSAAGEIVYQDGKPVAFQAAVLRKLYLGNRAFVGVVGSTLCSKPETSPVLLMKLMRATIKPRCGSLLFFANTAIPASAKMNSLLGVRGKVPLSCSKVRFVVLKWGAFINFVLKGRCPSFVVHALDFLGKPFLPWWAYKRLTDLTCCIDYDIGEAYEQFWRSYLDKNSGLVASRDSDTLRWMFQNEIKIGEAVLISLRDGDFVKGYVIAKQLDTERKRWMIEDWIAIGDDNAILSDLLCEMVCYLKTKEPAVWIEAIGYPMFAQPVLKRYLPLKRTLPNKVFLYKSYDTAIEDALTDMNGHSWFWGAYDGDRCL